MVGGVTRLTRHWPVVAILGLFLVIMLAAALQGRPEFHPPQSDPAPAPTLVLPESTSSGMPMQEPGEPHPLADIIGQVLLIALLVLVGSAVVAVLVVVARMLAGVWRERPLRRRLGAPVDVETGAAVAERDDARIVVEVVQRGIAGALRAIEAPGIPSDAIIAAWVGLEEGAADAGVPRGRAETPGEFVVRIITSRADISADTRTLLRLYERVRFGGHRADESDRVTARAALKRIEEGWR